MNRGIFFKYILFACGYILSVQSSIATEEPIPITMDYAIDYETFGLFQVDSSISLRHNLTNLSNDILRLRIVDTIFPIYTLQKTDGDRLQYHNTLSIPSPLFEVNEVVANDVTNAVDENNAQSDSQIVELASEHTYAFIDTLDLTEVEGLTSGSYFLTATVTIRYDDSSSTFFHTVQSEQIRLDIRRGSNMQSTPISPSSTDQTINLSNIQIEGTGLLDELNDTGGMFETIGTSYPHVVVDNMLTALVANNIEKFYSYFNIERLYRLDSSNDQRYIAASDIERELLLDQFMRELYDLPTFINSSLIPVQYEIHNTTYNQRSARVDVSMLFIYNDQELTTTTSILLELNEGMWVAIDYIALPER